MGVVMNATVFRVRLCESTMVPRLLVRELQSGCAWLYSVYVLMKG